MGDVFDAMNRAKRERERRAEHGADPAPPPPVAADEQSPAHEDGAPEEGGLPIDQVESAAQPRDQLAEQVTTAPVTGRSPVAAATDRARLERQSSRDDSVDEEGVSGGGQPTPAAIASLNGYSADIVVHHDRGSVITEQYRAIRTQVLARARNRRVQTHVITSSAPEEGKSVTTVNLGIAFSELRSQKTLLIEGDLRRPSFQHLFDRDIEHGLVDLLRGEETDVDKCIQPTVYENLQFLPAAGKEFAHSTELLSSPRMVQLLDRLKDRYDHIFIDTPPVITVTDACILGSMCDQTLLVVRLYRTPADVVDRAKRLLRAANCEVAGVILTHMEMQMSRYMYRYGYTYA
jgi:capsular exopolysaccharide synthesis family protein